MSSRASPGTATSSTRSTTHSDSADTTWHLPSASTECSGERNDLGEMTGLTTGNGLPNVVVTGVAMTTALATDAPTTWQRLLDGHSGIRLLEDSFVEEYDLPVRIGGHLLEDFENELNRIELRRLSYLQRMSTVLSRRVWKDAGDPEVDPKRLMVSIGTGMGSSEELLFAYDG